MTQRPPLILAYVVFIFAGIAFAGLFFHNDDLIVIGALLGLPTAIAHGIAFFVRARVRSDPAILTTRGLVVLGITLASMLGVVISQFVVINLYVDRPFGGESTAGFLWMTLLGLVVIRAWLVKSARRAALMQLVAVVIGIPQVVTTLFSSARDAGRAPGLALLAAFAVIGLAGAVLDKLFQDTEDKAPSQLPEATIIER